MQRILCGISFLLWQKGLKTTVLSLKRVLWVSFFVFQAKQSMAKLILIIGFTGLFTACTDPLIYNQLRYGDMTGEISDGYKANKIKVRCGAQCRALMFPPTIKVLLPEHRRQINRFLVHQNRHEQVFIAPCATWPITLRDNKLLARLVAQYVSQKGYMVWITKPVVPYSQTPQTLCVNLVRGQLAIIPPQCPNLKIKTGVYRVGSDFGCSSTYNLATMIDNPWDLIAPPGERGPILASRIARGNMNYNDGKEAKFLSKQTDASSADDSADSRNAAMGALMR